MLVELQYCVYIWCIESNKRTDRISNRVLFQNYISDGLSGVEGKDLYIPCMAPQNFQNFSLTWTFTRANKPTIVILDYDSRTNQTLNPWKGWAGLEKDNILKGNGSLLLQDPVSLEHTGIYMCTFSGLQSRHMVQTLVNIVDSPPGKNTVHWKVKKNNVFSLSLCYMYGYVLYTITPPRLLNRYILQMRMCFE